MNKPLAMRVLPMRLRASVWARCYRPARDRWDALYASAELAFAPGVTMKLVRGDVVSDSIAFTGMYELDHSRRIARLAKLGGTLVDVGANLGYFSLLWAAASPGNACIAFEASPRALPLLHENVARNGLADRITVVDKAAGDGPGSAQFDAGPPDQLGWGGFAATAGPDTVTVEVVRCDDVLDTDVALLKIDAEGADTLVLRGCERLLRARRIRRIWFEQHKPRMAHLGIDQDAATSFLRSIGYQATPTTDPGADIVAWDASPS